MSSPTCYLYSIRGAKGQQRSKVPLAAGVMLTQEELAFLKAISSIEPSPTLLRELRKAIATKTTKAVALKAKTSRMALINRHATTPGADSAAHSSSRGASQPIASKRETEELSSPDGLTIPANRRPAPIHQSSQRRWAFPVDRMTEQPAPQRLGG